MDKEVLRKNLLEIFDKLKDRTGFWLRELILWNPITDEYIIIEDRKEKQEEKKNG